MRSQANGGGATAALLPQVQGSEMADRVFVVVLNWNGWHDTIECLESILRSSGCSYSVVVCDNDSSDDSVARIADWAAGRLVFDSAGTPDSLRHLVDPPRAKPIDLKILNESDASAAVGTHARVTLIRNEANHGFAGGSNVGLRFAVAHADCDWVWLLNNDTVVAPDAMAELVARVVRNPGIGLCGSTVLYYDTPETVQALGGARLDRWFGITRHLRDG